MIQIICVFFLCCVPVPLTSINQNGPAHTQVCNPYSWSPAFCVPHPMYHREVGCQHLFVRTNQWIFFLLWWSGEKAYATPLPTCQFGFLKVTIKGMMF
jgi:hypothetical protein